MGIEYRVAVAYGFYGDEPSSDLEERISAVLAADPEDISELLMEDTGKLLKSLGSYELLEITPILDWSSGHGWSIYVAASEVSWYPREDEGFHPMSYQISAKAQAQLEALRAQLFPQELPEDPNGWGAVDEPEEQPAIGWFGATSVS